MLNNPYDKAIKFSFKNKAEAINFFNKFLPSYLLQKLHLDTLELDDNSYVDENLEEDFSDIVYRVMWGKTPIRVSLLLEHKSYPVAYPHLQLLRYMLNIWEYQLEQKEALAPVIPIVLYHDEKGWKLRPMYDYFEDLDEKLRQFIPHFEYLFIHLNQYTDEQIMQLKAGIMMSVLLLCKHKREEEYLKEHYEDIFLFLQTNLDKATKTTYTKTLFIFMGAIYGLIQEDLVNLSNQLADFKNNVNMDALGFLKKDVITFYTEGKVKGKVEGKAEGEIKGKIEKAIITITNIVQKLPNLSDNTIAEITEEEVSLVQKVREELAAGRDPKVTLRPQPKATPDNSKQQELLKKYITVISKRFPKWEDKKIAAFLGQKATAITKIKKDLPPPLKGFAAVENPFDKEMEKILNAHQQLPITVTFVDQLIQQFPNRSNYAISELAVVTMEFVQERKMKLEKKVDEK